MSVGAAMRARSEQVSAPAPVRGGSRTMSSGRSRWMTAARRKSSVVALTACRLGSLVAASAAAAGSAISTAVTFAKCAASAREKRRLRRRDRRRGCRCVLKLRVRGVQGGGSDWPERRLRAGPSRIFANYIYKADAAPCGARAREFVAAAAVFRERREEGYSSAGEFGDLGLEGFAEGGEGGGEFCVRCF